MLGLRAGLSIIVLSLVVSGCGTQTATEGASEVPAAVADVEQLADQTLAEIGGDAKQREAKHYLTFRELNQPFEECMQGQGVEYRAEYHTLNKGFLSNGTSGSWMGGLHRKPSQVALANAEAAYDEAVGEPDVLSSVEEDASEACEDAIGGENQVVESELSRDELVPEYARLIDAVDEQLGPISTYTECMEGLEIDYTSASDGQEGWAGLYLFLVGQMPKPPLPGREPDESWSNYLDLERRSLEADANCRADQYAEGLELLEPGLEEFRNLYAAELRASSTAWDDYVTQAEAAGFVWDESEN